ncbi:ribosomal-processing cysteine protease Prp [Clostridium sp. chh4-2]|uniref:ribosomal-processing cysteine protease Prp n=1 Tax=Clostridium sp. chh4-2 TaxID=2067550 RepID=UPI000CCF2364|nr:ribosomal-processing cysteine protease Prp [Clostridium sp. chh4-2]PNV63806.1 ribosomal-processing cysteine protease Prp [Clostridium sp. chh4-2]
MIKATVFRDSDQVYRGIDIAGHAGYAESGQDIICSAVSALALNMYNSVEAFTEDAFEGSVEEETGRFLFQFTEDISLESKLLMNSLVLGLENIQSEYGKQYIIIRYEEV